MLFKKGNGSWTQYRGLGSFVEIDFHDSQYGKREVPYWEAMNLVYDKALAALASAYEQGTEFVIFTHGWSTSRPGKTTARSMVRALMKSKEATPFIVRKKCIQH